MSKGEIGAGGATRDRELSINRMDCVGCSALAPLAIIGDTVGGGMAPSKAEELIVDFRLEKEREERERRERES